MSGDAVSGWHTRLTALFGMRVPILGGGLMGLSDAGYVAALVRAGCMAFITPRSFDTPAAFEQALLQCRRASGAAPFGVNLTLSNRLGANAEVPMQLALALQHGVRHFETVGPSPWALFERIHAAGGVLVHKCASVEHALKAESHGADAVALVGPEAGGHPGMNELSTQLLATLALQRLQVPLALGGGIGSGRQIASALALGCEGVVIGTRFLVGDEVAIHPAVRQRLLAARAEESVLRLRPTGHPWRVLDNATAREVAALEAAGATRYEDFGERVLGRTGLQDGWRGGDADAGLLSLGAGIGLANRTAALGTIVRELMDEAAAALDRVARLRQSPTAGPPPP
jgi:NADH:quinone reductase (non-electrogenic)